MGRWGAKQYYLLLLLLCENSLPIEREREEEEMNGRNRKSNMCHYNTQTYRQQKKSDKYVRYVFGIYNCAAQ